MHISTGKALRPATVDVDALCVTALVMRSVDKQRICTCLAITSLAAALLIGVQQGGHTICFRDFREWFHSMWHAYLMQPCRCADEQPGCADVCLR